MLPTNLPEGTPLWVVTIGIVLAMLGMFSKTMQEVKGPLGALARWWGARQVREIERSGDLNTAIEEEVRKRVESALDDVRDRITRLEDDLKNEREARRRDVAEIVLLREYAVEAAKREFALKQFAAANGLELPPPPLPTYQEWARARDQPGTDTQR